MLDVFDFFGDKGAIPEKIRESQKRRYAPVEAVDEIIALAEEAKAGECCSNLLSRIAFDVTC
jgi:seryl-tRNA synthetase